MVEATGVRPGNSGVALPVTAVVVTYEPDPAELKELLRTLARQARHVIVVDNASRVDVRSVSCGCGLGNLEFLRLDENFGLAHAQNLGIGRALSLGAQFIYLSDQDSLPVEPLLADLVDAWCSAPDGPPVAAIGPASVDRRTGDVSFFWRQGRVLPYRWKPLPGDPDTRKKAVEVEFLIASGTLMSAEAIRQIGGLRSGYFIDHVDTEWCFRAKAAGWRLLGAPGARLGHRLGDQVRRIWFLRWRNVAFHSPLRDYYMFRNTLLMVRDTPMPLFWRSHMLVRLVQFATYFLGLAGERRSRARLMALGLWHGMRNVAGRLDPATGRCRPVGPTPLDPRR